MNFLNPSPSLQDDFNKLWDEHRYLATKQKQRWRYLPLIITGKSWTGKDTVWQATQKILEEDFWFDFPYSRSRYLTRNMRPWEEDSHLNFISERDFKGRDFASSYKFAENFYGLDLSWAQDELESHNIAIMNSYPNEITKIFDLFFSIAVWQMYKRLSRYKHYNHPLTVEYSNDDSKNQENFNRNVLDALSWILRHISKYLEMTPEDIQEERIDFYRQHRDNRP